MMIAVCSRVLISNVPTDLSFPSCTQHAVSPQHSVESLQAQNNKRTSPEGESSLPWAPAAICWIILSFSFFFFAATHTSWKLLPMSVIGTASMQKPTSQPLTQLRKKCVERFSLSLLFLRSESN